MTMNSLQSLAVVCLLGTTAATASAQDLRTRLEKPEQRFFFYQVNLAGGYDTREPDDHWGGADRGAPTQFAVEWFGKSETGIQRGYTPLVAPGTWGIKLAVEIDPAETSGRDPNLNLRLLDTFVRFETKWDRTSFTVGHRGIPYGRNPRLDTELLFLPNQAPTDLGFGRDTGVFFQTPVSAFADLEVAVTAGGSLSGPLVVGQQEADGSGYDFDDRLDYRDSWLVTARVARPAFHRQELGFFVLTGETHTATGPLPEVSRFGVDWTIKGREDWTVTHQVSFGQTDGDRPGKRQVTNLLQNAELYLGSRWRVGVTHTYREEDFDRAGVATREIGTLFGSLSYALTRDIRLRVNPFVEYHDSAPGRHENGVLFQVCYGCGWRK
jgi:hypothetical protein